ncbi:helix-turn-helix domain-containing protein [Candidatus Glomeribacter gigasporarum]|uniref:helix-turn-helix domain-containing protein n=1 Tax=Candidatus Glomeribacter gigasporarum TaxID=132144 RepID=UPI00030BD7C3|nr:XRE family transcriptional regulator [Candidatus Glomeribacter gigasporarum]
MTDVLFNPSRLTLARKRRGLTMLKLASLIGVESRSISAYEKDEFRPENDRLATLAKVLRFPKSFFLGDDLDEPTPDVASFRALSKMTAGQRDMALGAGAIALMLNHWIEARFELPCAELLDLSREASPEAAAQTLRYLWGIGELPIKNVVHLLESKGVRVFSLSLDTTDVDAFSLWRQRTPFIFLNTRKSAEHARFDAAHELGHLVLHRHGSPQGREAEKEADTFASAFLMPRATLLTQVPRLTGLSPLIPLKKFWGVSLAALVYRLHKIGALSPWHYQMLYMELSSRGYRKKEPYEGQRETSQVLQKVFAALRHEGVTKKEMACDLCIPVEELEQLIFGLAITSLDGAGEVSRRSRSRNVTLRIVHPQNDTSQ